MVFTFKSRYFISAAAVTDKSIDTPIFPQGAIGMSYHKGKFVEPLTAPKKTPKSKNLKDFFSDIEEVFLAAKYNRVQLNRNSPKNHIRKGKYKDPAAGQKSKNILRPTSLTM
jgi:hypothetical protein